MKTLTGLYTSADQVRNTCDDLINCGIDAEKIYGDLHQHWVKVMMPDSAIAEVSEILSRHQPSEIHSFR